MLVQMAHKAMLGEKLQKVRLCDLICVCVCAVAAVGIFIVAAYERAYKILIDDLNEPFPFIPVAVFSFIVMLALIAQSCVRRKVYKTPKLLFSLQITGAILIFLNGVVFSVSRYFRFEGGIDIVYWIFTSLSVIVAVLQIIFSAIHAKRGVKNILPMLFYALPFYLFIWCMQIGGYLILYSAPTFLLYLAWLLVVLNIAMAAVQIADTLITKKRDKQ